LAAHGMHLTDAKGRQQPFVLGPSGIKKYTRLGTRRKGLPHVDTESECLARCSLAARSNGGHVSGMHTQQLCRATGTRLRSGNLGHGLGQAESHLCCSALPCMAPFTALLLSPICTGNCLSRCWICCIQDRRLEMPCISVADLVSCKPCA